MNAPAPTARAARRRAAADDPLIACARALADVAGATVDESGLLSDEASGPGEGEATPRRGRADIAALHRAHHDEALHRARAPREAVPRALFAALERERVEALGANRWAGVRRNLDALRDGDGGVDADPAARASAALVGLVRAALSPTAPRWNVARRDAVGLPGVARAAVDDIALRVQGATADLLPPLAASLENQDAYAERALALICRLGLGNAPGDADGEAGGGALDSPADADAVGDGEADVDPDDEASTDEDPASVDGETSEDEADETTLAGESEEAVEAPAGEARDEPPVAGVDPRGADRGVASGYRIWSRAFDEVVDARSLASPETLVLRRAELDRHLERQGRLVRRLATRLQKVLLARQRREWQFDMDEGQLDTRRLSRLISDPLGSLVFKAELDSAVRDTTVTLLIDNSRSMIGRPIMIAAACADLLARTFERCGVAVEVLGFTTVELHGGRSTAAWEAAGRPAGPGRLNDVRHIVYKSADMPYRSARQRLALMLERDLLKQNIDGEALLWAASRLMKRPTERRILLVISDGAPVDTTTLSVNPRDYLDRHLDAVVAEIERRGTIELAAIGIGHDVARFYAQAMSVFDARGLAPALLSRLESLFRTPR